MEQYSKRIRKFLMELQVYCAEYEIIRRISNIMELQVYCAEYEILVDKSNQDEAYLDERNDVNNE